MDWYEIIVYDDGLQAVQHLQNLWQITATEYNGAKSVIQNVDGKTTTRCSSWKLVKVPSIANPE